MNPITASQMRKIHVLSKERGLDGEMLHSFVYSITRKDSLKKLSIAEAIKVIDSLSGRKYTAPGMASESQMRFIYSLMKELGWVDEAGKPDESRLVGFLQERFGISRLEWLSSKTASDAIEAFKAMKRREQKVI